MNMKQFFMLIFSQERFSVNSCAVHEKVSMCVRARARARARVCVCVCVCVCSNRRFAQGFKKKILNEVAHKNKRRNLLTVNH